MLTQKRLKEVLNYCPETGVFTRKIRTSNRVKVGAPAGCTTSQGYVAIRVDRRRYKAHRLAWLYVHGVWPNNDIDHDDRDRSNNRIDNLRDVTHKQNHENTGLRDDNTSGFRGVSSEPRTSKWVARIMHHGKQVNLGTFPTPESASEAYEAMRDRLYTHHKREEQ